MEQSKTTGWWYGFWGGGRAELGGGWAQAGQWLVEASDGSYAPHGAKEPNTGLFKSALAK